MSTPWGAIAILDQRIKDLQAAFRDLIYRLEPEQNKKGPDEEPRVSESDVNLVDG